MADSPPKPRRRLLRGGVFWLSVALAGLIAGSWIKSYWRSDWLGVSRMAIQDVSGRVVFQNRMHYGAEDWNSHSSGYPSQTIVGYLSQPAWHYGGFRYCSFTLTTSVQPTTTSLHFILVPHWFPLLLCLAAAWWASRPWRKHKRDTRRGFEVLAR